MLCPKTLGLSLPRTTEIADHTNSTKNKELRPRTFESRRFPWVWRHEITIKMHEASTHVSLKEIQGKTLSNLRNQPKNENTKEALKRPTWIITPNLLCKPWKIHTGLTCLLNIHPSLMISPWSSQASPMENLGKIGRENSKSNELGFWEIVAILSPLSIYGGIRKTKLPLLHNTRIHTPEGHFGNSRRSTIGRMPGDRTSLSLDASLAIPMRVLRFEASRHAQIPSPPDEPPVSVLWLNQVTRRVQTPVVCHYPTPTPVHDFVLLFLPPCGTHLTPLATGSLKPILLVSPLLGGPARHRPLALAIHMHQCKSNRNLHLQYSAKNQSTPRCQSLITARSDHPPVLRCSGPHTWWDPSEASWWEPTRG
jgi:hypothetical protein